MSDKAVLATDKNGELFVLATALMPPMIAMFDGLKLHHFDGDGEDEVYLSVDDALEWCKKESKTNPSERLDLAIKTLERFKVQEGKA